MAAVELQLILGIQKRTGFLFSLTVTAQGGAIAGAGAIVGGSIAITNADNVNKLNGISYQVGRAGIGPAYAESIIGDGHEGFKLGGGVGVGYTAGSATVSTTSAIYQYNNGVNSIGNTGKSSMWSSGK